MYDVLIITVFATVVWITLFGGWHWVLLGLAAILRMLAAIIFLLNGDKRDDDNYTVIASAPTDPPPPKPQTKKKGCPYCGTTLKNNEVRCRSCGAHS